MSDVSGVASAAHSHAIFRYVRLRHRLYSLQAADIGVISRDKIFRPRREGVTRSPAPRAGFFVGPVGVDIDALRPRRRRKDAERAFFSRRRDGRASPRRSSRRAFYDARCRLPWPLAARRRGRARRVGRRRAEAVRASSGALSYIAAAHLMVRERPRAQSRSMRQTFQASSPFSRWPSLPSHAAAGSIHGAAEISSLADASPAVSRRMRAVARCSTREELSAFASLTFAALAAALLVVGLEVTLATAKVSPIWVDFASALAAPTLSPSPSAGCRRLPCARDAFILPRCREGGLACCDAPRALR